MAQVSRQPRQLGVDIDAVLRPGCEPMNGEGMSKLIWTSSDTPTRGLDAEFAQQSPDGERRYRHGQRRPVETHEQHAVVVSPAPIQHLLSLGHVAADLRGQVRPIGTMRERPLLA